MDALTKWKMCDRKKSYETQSKANKAAAKRRIVGRAYECPVCFCWHITKHPPTETQEDDAA